MDITKEIQKLKNEENFKEKVGMMLIHNGVVRGTSRKDGKKVSKLVVKTDYQKINEIVNEYKKKKGIYKIIVEAKEGEFMPGDDLLFIIVAGDIRPNVKPVLSEVLEKVKSECFQKKEL